MNNANPNTAAPSLHQADRPRQVTSVSSLTQTASETISPDS